MGRPVVHWEFWSPDTAKLAEFYKSVFDWSPRAIPDLNYTLVETGGTGGINGGMMTPQAGPWPAKLSLYIDVDDLDVYAAKITAAGGKMLVEKMDVPGVGQLSLFEDPDGRVLGMWKQGQPA
jgi:predicted enzyme related to lactoylglutathione lyase